MASSLEMHPYKSPYSAEMATILAELPLISACTGSGVSCLAGFDGKIKPVAASGSLPIIGAAHAGEPCPAFELDCGSIPCPEEYCKEGNFFIKITGDSMNNVLTDGSYALIDTHVDTQSGDIALV